MVPTFGEDFKQFSQSNRFTAVFNDKEVAVFQNPSVLPRAWMVPTFGIETFSNVDMEVARLKSSTFDPLRFVTISGAAPQTSPAAAFKSSVDTTDSNANSLTIKTQSSGPGVLLVSQTYYPGWKATVDGTQTDVLQADVTLTGVSVPAGTHEVRLVFQPLSFRIGLGITIFSTILLLALLVYGLRSKRQRTKRDAVSADKVREIPVR